MKEKATQDKATQRKAEGGRAREVKYKMHLSEMLKYKTSSVAISAEPNAYKPVGHQFSFVRSIN